MRPQVAHINLLQKTAPSYTVGPAFAVVLAVSLGALGWYGQHTWSAMREATVRRDAMAQEAKDLQARIAALSGEQQKNAAALALRQEIDELRPQAQAAQAFSEAVKAAGGGRSQDFGRALAVLTGTTEPGLWFTGLNVLAGGRKLEVRGEARDGAVVLRFARKVNNALKPLQLQLDQLDVQPLNRGTGSGTEGSGPVAFTLN